MSAAWYFSINTKITVISLIKLSGKYLWHFKWDKFLSYRLIKHHPYSPVPKRYLWKRKTISWRYYVAFQSTRRKRERWCCWCGGCVYSLGWKQCLLFMIGGMVVRWQAFMSVKLAPKGKHWQPLTLLSRILSIRMNWESEATEKSYSINVGNVPIFLLKTLHSVTCFWVRVVGCDVMQKERVISGKRNNFGHSSWKTRRDEPA